MLFTGFLPLLWYNLVKNDQKRVSSLFDLFREKIDTQALGRTNNV